ncbi:DUF202 domain-containing protein [Demequina sp. SYSU T00192]|uniref:DUF202 domain-containing protein n=1 Tax=Demequina litoralis TaxID=3051660 RepID=A0ABT8GAU6_9MICO|nr:DUF202 domain-containing protein [Demequina sp. SYSU T00192]MDN4476263.1 DUF202 domain-containing protein [Demequina sp. SYSU T00192]
MDAARTFLAWIRTAVGLLITALLLVALDVPIDEGWRLGAAGLVLLLAIAAAAQGWFSWRTHARPPGNGEAAPDLRIGSWLTWGVVAAGLLLLVGWVMT